MNNQHLLEQLRSGNAGEALKELYKSFPVVRNFILGYDGNEDDARDIFQEALLIVFKAAQKPEFTLTSASLNTYLVSVCRYMWKDELQKRNRLKNIEIIHDHSNEVETHLEQEVRYKWLDKILNSLGDKCAEILKLFYVKKMAMEDIAQNYGYKSADTAKTQKYKCLERAKEMASKARVTMEDQEA